MPISGFTLDVLLGTLPLRILADEDGNPQYREEVISGADIPSEASGVHFSDEFTSWHKGAFITEDIQDGYYNTAENVDCSYPGRIFPSFKKEDMLQIPARSSEPGGHPNNAVIGPIAGITSWPWEDGVGDAPALLTYYHEAVAGDGLRLGALSIVEFDIDGVKDTAAGQSLARSFGGSHFNYIDPVWFLDRWFVPMVDAYASYDSGTTWTIHANVEVKAFGVAPDRLYRLHSTGGFLHISNMDVAADPTAIASWTDPGLRIPNVTSGNFEMDRILIMGRFPFIATKSGIYTIGRGGYMEALFPQMLQAPSRSYEFKAYRHYQNMIATATTSGEMLLLDGQNATRIGPLINPLSRFPGGNAPQILDIFATSTGIIFAAVFDGANRQIWKGVQRTPGETGPGRFSWHPILEVTGDREFGGNEAMTRPLAMINFSRATPYADANRTRLWYGGMPGRVHRWEIGSWGDLEGSGIRHEDGAVRTMMSGTANAAVTFTATTLTDTRLQPANSQLNTNMWTLGATFTIRAGGSTGVITANDNTDTFTVSSWVGGTPANGVSWTIEETVQMIWRSGRYDRGNKKSSKHWTSLGFIAENLAAGGGQTITVETSVDGGAFAGVANQSGGTLSGAGPFYRIPIDRVGHDLEIRLTFNPEVSTGIASPPTIRRIIWEGRDVPQSLVMITMVVEGDPAPQAGGVRSKDWANTVFNSINLLTQTVKQTFRDPFRSDRTVAVVPSKSLDIQQVEGESPPQSTILVRLLVVPGTVV